MSDIPLSVMMGLGAREEEEPSVELGPGETSLHFFQRVYRDPAPPMPRRMAAAKEAVGFEHPKQSAVGIGYLTGDTFASRLEGCLARSDPNGPYYKMIEARAVEVEDAPVPVDGDRDPRE